MTKIKCTKDYLRIHATMWYCIYCVRLRHNDLISVFQIGGGSESGCPQTTGASSGKMNAPLCTHPHLMCTFVL